MREQKIAEAYRLWMQALDNMRAALAMNPLVIAPFRTSAQAFDSVGRVLFGTKGRSLGAPARRVTRRVPQRDSTWPGASLVLDR